MNVSNVELLITLSTFLVEYNNQNIHLILKTLHISCSLFYFPDHWSKGVCLYGSTYHGLENKNAEYTDRVPHKHCHLL